MNKLQIFVNNNWISLTLFILFSITTLSLWPMENLPDIPGTDKTHHLIAYAVLMFPVALSRPNKWMMFSILFITYSGIIELIQPWVNRYGEWLDLAANSAGVVCGLVIALLVNHFFPPESNPVSVSDTKSN